MGHGLACNHSFHIALTATRQVSDLLTAVERYTRKQGVDMRHLFERFDWNGGSAAQVIPSFSCCSSADAGRAARGVAAIPGYPCHLEGPA
jgi:hypothetical protein